MYLFYFSPTVIYVSRLHKALSKREHRRKIT